MLLHLASKSPQRSRLLHDAGIAFVVVDSDCDEEHIVDDDAEQLARKRALGKAQGARIRDGLALGADTVVAVGTAILNKPSDDADARRMLGLLSGSTHRVITGHALCVFRNGVVVHSVQETCVSTVTMRALTTEEIAAYVASGESRGRAGAYAIQEHGDAFVTQITGAMDTVIGLHVAAVQALQRAVIQSGGCA